MLKVLLLLTVYTGGEWHLLTEPQEAPSIEECTKYANAFLAQAQTILDIDHTVIGISANCIITHQKEDDSNNG
jgi:hypothetical protein